MILLACHIPFIFFSGKEGLLIIIDEVDRQSISNALFYKLYATNTTFYNQNQNSLPPNPELPIPGSQESENGLVIDANISSPKAVSTIEVGSSLRSHSQELSSQHLRMSMQDKMRLSTLTVDEVNRMAYKDMLPCYYYSGTLTMFGLTIVGSILIPNVTTIFNFVAAFSISAIAFFFPSLFYLKGSQKYKGETLYYRRLSYVYFIIGCFNVVLGLSATILSILGLD